MLSRLKRPNLLVSLSRTLTCSALPPRKTTIVFHTFPSRSFATIPEQPKFLVRITEYPRTFFRRFFLKFFGFLRTVGTMVRACWHDPKVVGHWVEDLRDSVRHGWKWVKNGFRLFWKNISISKRLVWKSFMGHQLSLRESKLLVTTTSDLFKLVPFSFFIIIPFAELALPIFLRLFPNMLPSTFMERNFADSAQISRRIRAKKELAEFFQDVIEEKNKRAIEEAKIVGKPSRKMDLLEQFQELMRTSSSDFPPVTELVRFAKLFEDEFKLENMSLEHLSQICRILGIEPFAFKSHVVLQLRHTVNRLQAEDRRIMWEGVDALTRPELEEACHARGMPTVADEVTMRKQLEHWLQLSSSKDVPVSLLLWSRTFFRHQPSELPPVVEEPSVESSELFEETAERQKERAEDVERRLEQLEQLEQEGGEEEKIPEKHDRDELIDRTAKLQAELDLYQSVVTKQEDVLAHQIEFLANLQSIPWLQDGASSHVHRDQVRDVKDRVSLALIQFQTDLNEIETLMAKSKNIDLSIEDHRFYPEEDEKEVK